MMLPLVFLTSFRLALAYGMSCQQPLDAKYCLMSYHGDVAKQIDVVEALGVFYKLVCKSLGIQNSMVNDHAIEFTK
jgi:hypothetical protein